MRTIGIECESLEGKRFGVGHTLAQFLSEAAKTPEIEKKYKFILYFKKSVPKDAFLEHSVFEKKILTGGIIPPSFNIFYHIMIPIYALKDRPDLLYMPSYMLPAFFIGRNAIVVLTNDVYYEAYYGSLPFRHRLSYALFCAWAAKRAKKIMTISEFSKKELMQFYNLPSERIFVNYWGLGSQYKILERNAETLEKIEKIKNKHGIKKDFILSVGQAFERRRVKEAMEAFEKIAEKFPDVQYLVPCADKNNPPVLDELAEKINKRLGRDAIIRAGYIDADEQVYLFNFAKLLIYVSDKEALGLPPAEALVCGTPAVVIDNELTHEVFGGYSFFVKNPKDISEYASVIEDALSNSAKRDDIIKNRGAVIEKFSWPQHVKKFLQEIDAI